ncbi:hypothetical protein H5410_056535 [Solanum commersonii]|uniref:Uncharacterized protein n=1 Tax=Solanum commersonii TaxID=4109 RepID=A0A9J5WKH5_SOLCO|nr:hypothetical protein H5410_056535 [Solanum commersonii]
MEPVGSCGKIDPFSRSNRPWILGSFGDPDFRRYFFQNFSWTFVKTLYMELDGPDRHTAQFQGQTNPGAGKPHVLPTFVCHIVHGSLADLDFDVIFAKSFAVIYQDLSYGNRLVSPGKAAIFKVKWDPKWMSVKTLDMEPIGLEGQLGSFSWSNDPQSG